MSMMRAIFLAPWGVDELIIIEIGIIGGLLTGVFS